MCRIPEGDIWYMGAKRGERKLTPPGCTAIEGCAKQRLHANVAVSFANLIIWLGLSLCAPFQGRTVFRVDFMLGSLMKQRWGSSQSHCAFIFTSFSLALCFSSKPD